MSVTGNGSKNEPEFASTGNTPTFAADLEAVSDYAAEYGSHKIGTTAERNAFTPWEGLLWDDTDLNVTLRHDGSGWVRNPTAVVRVARATALTLTMTYTAVAWSSAPVLFSGGWSIANATRLVLPISGYWEVLYSAPGAGSSDGRATRSYLRKDGSTILAESADQRAGATVTFEPHVKGSALILSSGTSYVELFVDTTNAAGTPQITTGSSMWAKFLGNF